MTESVVRKLDSDDVTRLRSHHVIFNGAEGPVANTGALMKTTICCGYKQLAHFSDVIDERVGVTDEIFARRWSKEFRLIPPSEIDGLFKAANDVNQFIVQPEEHQKK